MTNHESAGYRLVSPIDRDKVALSVGTEGGVKVAIAFADDNGELHAAEIKPHTVKRELDRIGAFVIEAESVPPGQLVVVDYDPFMPDESHGRVTYYPLEDTQETVTD